MQNKGVIRLFAILLALVCFYQLSFTFIARSVEKDAKEASGGDLLKEVHYLDSISSETVYNFLWIRKYNYKEVKQREINLGLDLKGGMNVTLEISVVDLVRALSNYSKDSTFNAAIRLAQEKQKSSQEDFVALFGQAFEEIDPNARMAANFLTPELKERITFSSTNEQVLKVIEEEADAAIDNSFNILRSRIDRFGVAQPNIQKLSQRGRILVELPGVKDKSRVRTLLQGTASLEFWETYENSEVYPFLLDVNELLKDMNVGTEKSAPATENPIETINEQVLNETVAEEAPETASVEETAADSAAGDELSLLDELKTTSDSARVDQNVDVAKDFPLFAVLTPNANNQGQLFNGPIIGFSHFGDTAKVNQYFSLPQVKALLPRDLKLTWHQKPFDENGNFYQLIALKITTRDGRAPLDGGVITDARQDFGQGQASAEVNMNMNSEGAKIWARMTKDNIGKSIAIVLDNYVVSYPTVQVEITGGRSNITGNFTVEEAKDLANMLKSGKMPAPANIVEEYVVGPSLGQESINSGMYSFLIAFVLVLLYMLFMYSYHAGAVANVALLTNLFFLIGVLASFGAVLTLPGIAGIVLTMGMAVDANVLIYERISDELRGGKGLKLAVKDGYRNAYSAIIDGQVTTLLTGIVLYFFGSGPIKGFATTLIIGIGTSLFTSIFITRLVFENMLGRDRQVKFISKMTTNLLQNMHIRFVNKRKVAYIISGILIAISITSMVTKGFDFGIDFKGGRTYVVNFKQDVKVADISAILADEFGNAPEVKTFGSDNQVRITTDYHIDDESATIDNQIEDMLYQGLKPVTGEISKQDFTENYIMSSTKVGPTISDDIQRDAMIALTLALAAIFLYILIRFRKWQYGLGGVASLAHDSIITLGMFSLFSGILPFSLEIDQAFIAAILTVIGYSINDTVIIFDRIREYTGLYPKRTVENNMDNAINSTLRRTMNTSLSTLVVLLAIFLFGGESIRGFIFALLIGIGIGTYSSIFVATPVAFDTIKRSKKSE
ncbi:MAG TPA: protein translocase subunit SecDF [Prolixibacteraceae bacterium]|nr:protein translocase subunit SecDF [Prolixibacteraceae bacterium]